jgi:AP-1 complex subunit mu
MSAVYILDNNGRVLISFDYRGDSDFTVPDKFMRFVQSNGSPPPVFRVDEWCFAYLFRSPLYFFIVSRSNSNITAHLVFLESLEKLLRDYLVDLTPESIVDHFAVVYQLLDEVMDYGYPQIVEAKALETYILKHKRGEIVPKAVPVVATGVVSWRNEGIHYTINEVFIDVWERVNLLVANNGALIQHEVEGEIILATYLSGMPELRIGLNDAVLFHSDPGPQTDISRSMFQLEDLKFHQCVRVGQYMKDRSITFIPPDGKFTLMRYRLSTTVKPIVWVDATIERYKRSRVEMQIVARSDYPARSIAENVKIIIPVPIDAESPKGKYSVGTMKYIPKDNQIVWNINKFAGEKQYTLRVHFELSSVESESEEWHRPIQVQFTIPLFTISGLKVLYMRVYEGSGYKTTSWVKYVTRHANYEFRT